MLGNYRNNKTDFCNTKSCRIFSEVKMFQAIYCNKIFCHCGQSPRLVGQLTCQRKSFIRITISSFDLCFSAEGKNKCTVTLMHSTMFTCPAVISCTNSHHHACSLIFVIHFKQQISYHPANPVQTLNPNQTHFPAL